MDQSRGLPVKTTVIQFASGCVRTIIQFGRVYTGGILFYSYGISRKRKTAVISLAIIQDLRLLPLSVGIWGPFALLPPSCFRPPASALLLLP